MVKKKSKKLTCPLLKATCLEDGCSWFKGDCPIPTIASALVTVAEFVDSVNEGVCMCEHCQAERESAERKAEELAYS